MKLAAGTQREGGERERRHSADENSHVSKVVGGLQEPIHPRLEEVKVYRVEEHIHRRARRRQEN